MNAFTPPHDFSGQPYRANDVVKTIRRAHLAVGSALVPYTRRASRRVRERITDVLKAIQFFPMYLNGISIDDIDGALNEASNAIAALDAATAQDRRTIAGRFAEWLHFRRHPEDYVVFAVAPSPSGKGRGVVIPNHLDWNGPVQTHEPKADPDTPD
jgi:hypothetical protein